MYNPYFLPYYGGCELATYNLAKELMTFCDIKVYAFNWIPSFQKKKNYGFSLSSGLPKEEIVNGVYVHRNPITNLPVVKDFSIKLIKEVSSSDVDVLHFQGVHRLFSRWLLQKVAKKKIKILTTHALHEAISILRRSDNFWISPFFIKSLHNMDHIIALSKTDVNLLLHLGIHKNRITVIPNGISPDKFVKRRQFVERNAKMKILCVARFAENKNYESLIYVISKLINHLDLEAYFVGNFSDHKYFEKVRHLIKKEGLERVVKICLSLDDPAVTDCYLSCDLFVLPSKMETFPLVILEAMYAGLPIVSTDVGDIPDIITNGINGFIVAPNDSEELYRKCLILLGNKKMRQKMGTVNKETAKKYTWKNIALSTFTLYQKLLESKRSR
jgi:glycosyltransferase involved in cell wall biosynthesis